MSNLSYKYDNCGASGKLLELFFFLWWVRSRLDDDNWLTTSDWISAVDLKKMGRWKIANQTPQSVLFNFSIFHLF